MQRLPNEPHLDHLRQQAKDVRTATGVKLTEAQHQTAVRYGFTSWHRLQSHVRWRSDVIAAATKLSRSPAQVEASDMKLLIDGAAKHPNPRTRVWCIQIAQRFGDDVVAPVINRGLEDPVPRVRRHALYAATW